MKFPLIRLLGHMPDSVTAIVEQKNASNLFQDSGTETGRGHSLSESLLFDLQDLSQS